VQRNPFKTSTVIVDRTFSNGVRRFLIVRDHGDGAGGAGADWWTADMHPTLREALNSLAPWANPNVPVLTAREFEALTGINALQEE